MTKTRHEKILELVQKIETQTPNTQQHFVTHYKTPLYTLEKQQTTLEWYKIFIQQL